MFFVRQNGTFYIFVKEFIVIIVIYCDSFFIKFCNIYELFYLKSALGFKLLVLFGVDFLYILLCVASFLSCLLIPSW